MFLLAFSSLGPWASGLFGSICTYRYKYLHVPFVSKTVVPTLNLDRSMARVLAPFAHGFIRGKVFRMVVWVSRRTLK